VGIWVSGYLGVWVSGSLGGLSGPADDNSGLASLVGVPGGKLVPRWPCLLLPG
jgi:hypothetical protein